MYSKGTKRERKKRMWVADVGGGRGLQVERKNARMRECEKCAKVEGMLYPYGAEMYWGGDLIRKMMGKWRTVSVSVSDVWHGVSAELCTVVI